MNELYDEFIRITKHLNNELEIIPVLYGSLGLQIISGIDFSPQDIDILVQLQYIDKEWNAFESVIEKLGYKLVDLHEHEFHKDHLKLAFASVENLPVFAGVNHAGLEMVTVNGASYQRLTLYDYLKVYSRSLHDGYRRTKNNNKDLLKIQAIKKVLGI